MIVIVVPGSGAGEQLYFGVRSLRLLRQAYNVPMGRVAASVYSELRAMIAAAIADCTYTDGGMLPSMRAFATEQAANPLVRPRHSGISRAKDG